MSPRLRAALLVIIGGTMGILLWRALPNNPWVTVAVLIILVVVWLDLRRRGA